MPSIDVDRFLAAGCITINEAESGICSELWSAPLLQKWHSIKVSDSIAGNPTYDPSVGPVVIADSNPPLHSMVQNGLLESPALSPFLSLLGSKWVHMTFRITPENPTIGILRVYILPDDVENRRFPRFDARLQQLRAKLFQLLDRSSGTWDGNIKSQKVKSNGHEDGKNTSGNPQSLLQMFNTLPAPEPQPSEVNDPDRRKSMCNLLENKVRGLKTIMYPFQCRSAALMLQRESQTEPVPDPRLPKRYVDHLGTTYYVDPVVKTIIIDPAYYDSVCGGVLAEEMGSGKTLICLALILETKNIPATVPELYRGAPIVRPKIGSLMDMAAAVISRSGVAWKENFGFDSPDTEGIQYNAILKAIQRNPGWYGKEAVIHPGRRTRRRETAETQNQQIYLSHASLIIVPPNLVTHWEQEINKHTSGLRVLFQTKTLSVPPVEDLKEFDIVLFSRAVFDRLYDKRGTNLHVSSQLATLAKVHFKRCIIDEGHVLGASSQGGAKMTNLQRVMDCLQIDAKWVVTGTPSVGLYGLENGVQGSLEQSHQVSTDIEVRDLRKIGVMAAVFLKARPWANTLSDTRGEWKPGKGRNHVLWDDYIVKPWSSRTADGQDDCLKAALGSLIVRHPKLDIVPFLPSVTERTVYLDGSYQDILALNLFSMHIIFNAVQSERKDQDYFFHKSQRTELGRLVNNLRQASFFGGQFWPKEQILTAIRRAEEFLDEGEVEISAEDDELLRKGIEFGWIAVKNEMKDSAYRFVQVPVYVENFPYGAGEHWSVAGSRGGKDPVCTVAPLLLRLQDCMRRYLQDPKTLDDLAEKGFISEQGDQARSKLYPLLATNSKNPNDPPHHSNNSNGGEDEDFTMKRERIRLEKQKSNRRTIKSMMQAAQITKENEGLGSEAPVAAPLAKTRLISTASAKLSYLIDQIIQHQASEQILIFYENDNVAYYLAETLEVLGIQHLIYAKGITTERRNRYLAAFTDASGSGSGSGGGSKFRVMLMDISQAAFGLDMKTASRIYFINPILNPQQGAQAIGRARRISQQKPVTVETLVLRGSMDEVIARRREEMSPAEQRKCKSGRSVHILDDKPIYDWIRNAKILPLPKDVNCEDGQAQMAKLAEPQNIFFLREHELAPNQVDKDDWENEDMGSLALKDDVREFANSMRRKRKYQDNEEEESSASSKRSRHKWMALVEVASFFGRARRVVQAVEGGPSLAMHAMNEQEDEQW
ncbi:P-loop containing nucleoside triphosphate hydrolase protein [Sordaria brevicollis]|uniref:P-loop containing nucleoside triphosphate hydrolase protein n=1 Tax=Sordaria brevicollis TaxID=83679 RepID=A0AAE0UBL9_SORBR|nr:P-loop containing nucleoside triphosphate hydrolase protein [Sordaria brevicollis]